MNNTYLRKKIMRRIYTAYGMRILGGARGRHAFIMLLSLIALVRFVSVVNVAENFSQVSVGHAGQFILSALEHTELWTLGTLVLLMYATVAFIRGESLSTPSRKSTSFA